MDALGPFSALDGQLERSILSSIGGPQRPSSRLIAELGTSRSPSNIKHQKSHALEQAPPGLKSTNLKSSKHAQIYLRFFFRGRRPGTRFRRRYLSCQLRPEWSSLQRNRLVW